ncbi:MAG TPA: thioredoxin TrxC [Pseudomonadales bacterium]|jgi:thioredoxin 2|nr:thioredoxin TrxC [Pseudomonadales bacterium]HMW84230.1 thioredoxin TrxC [Pseudomonadales bacterium]HMY97886.1 thioredoxin TrxC [Pseudomonadales bacterium]HMZ71867.1 thioredoxin TrxC [Pseudomonadales bacterium]HMZ92817.1 thioredoxin TrxC [Pseudomonadales bacterium]
MLQINCPHCFVTNRLPAQRLGDRPNCGRCKQPLFTGTPLELTEANLTATLTRNDIPLVVDCWAAWCGPCRSFAPTFSQAAARYEPPARFAKLDTEALPAVAQQWAIRSIPTLILFRNGQEVQRQAGALSPPQLAQWLKQAGVV